MPRKDRKAEVNSSSMADIAFLLLIFFLVTTTIANPNGLTLLLPPKPDDTEQIDVKVKDRNVLKVLVNSSDRVAVEDEPLEDIGKLKQMVIDHVLNYGSDDKYSESPKDAIVSLKTDRGTSYEIYIAILDACQGAYYEIYAAKASEIAGRKVTDEEFRNFDLKDPEQKKLYDEAREGIPMAISIAEPTKQGGA